jgi:hypothetical protein
MNNELYEKLYAYCQKYDIPIEYLPEILLEPKVIPMIRGKAFEFSVLGALRQILPEDVWLVDKPMVNAQFGLHDTDVRIIHRPTRKIISAECKLVGKGTFKLNKDESVQARVKCMRSRTLGESKIKELAPKLGISEGLLKVHNDQYVPADFQVVITNLANAFYETDEETDLFEWQPNDKGTTFLKFLSGLDDLYDLQHFAYHKMYLANSQHLAVLPTNNLTCTREKCTEPQSCGFIPNYPLLVFDKNQKFPRLPWVDLVNSSLVLEKVIEEKLNLSIFEGKL